MRQIQGKLYLLGAFTLAGTSVITGYILALKLSSFVITAMSLGIVLICLLPFYGRKTVRTIRTLAKGDWMMILLQAIFGIFLFRTLMLFGLKLTSTVEAGILTGTTPAITAILALVFLREQLSKATVLGIGCTVVGITLLQGTDILSTQFSIHHVWGNVLVICAAASESIFNVISRKHKAGTRDKPAAELDPMVQTLLVSAIALVFSIIPALCERPLASIATLGWKEWVALVWYGLGVTALAFVFFYEGVKRCDTYTTAAFSGMMPLTSMLLSLFLLKEGTSYMQWVGGLLIIFSMALIGRAKASRSVVADQVRATE